VSAQFPPLGDTIQIAWVGRIVEWKGLHVLLEAVEELAARKVPIRVQVAGDAVQGRPEYSAALRRRVADHSLPVTFLGHIQDVDAMLRTSDVLVHSSVRGEPFGQVIVQGLAAGCAVIASRAGGPAEILDDRVTGLLYDPGDSRQLADCITSLVSDHDRLRNIATAGLERAKDFTDEVTSHSLDMAIQEACQPSGTTPEGRP
jgi:glycosyltransferase involved in cell wall biosynthesis